MQERSLEITTRDVAGAGAAFHQHDENEIDARGLKSLFAKLMDTASPSEHGVQNSSMSKAGK